MTALEELSAWASALRPAGIPDRVTALARSQVLSQLAAIRAGWSHPLGQRLVAAYGHPLQDDPARAAQVLSGLGSWLHLDDTAYAGHVGNASVAVPLAYGLRLGLDGPGLLAAVVAADECASRVTATATLGPFRGQNAAHTHIAGAIAGRLHCEGAPAERWVDAFALALAMAPWPVMHGFLGSDAKVLSAALPVRLGLDACDAAGAGLHGAADVVEHPDGFLARFAEVPLPGELTTGLGTRWHTDTLSFKVHPGGPGLDAALDCVQALLAERAPLAAEAIETVVVDTSLYTVEVDARAGAYLDGPRSPVSALVFSVGYCVASALLTGGLSAADFAPEAVADPARWALAAKVQVRHDPTMTRASLHAQVPFGAALRAGGDRARTWLGSLGGPALVELVGELGPPPPCLEDAEKVTGAAVTVRTADGRCRRHEQAIPVGAAGAATRAAHPALTRAKFLATGASPAVADGLGRLERASAREVADLLCRALTPGDPR